MAMRLLLPLLLLLVSTKSASAQQERGSVHWMGDPKALEFMAGYPKMTRVIEGFRVQIHLGSKTDAVRVRQNFLLRHPEIPAYMSYLAPNFRIRVGDMRDRVEAERLLKDLRNEFPGSYVVADHIEPPPLPLEETDPR